MACRDCSGRLGACRQKARIIVGINLANLIFNCNVAVLIAEHYS